MSCLIIHHVESQWASAMKQRGRDFYEYLEHLHDYLRQQTEFDKVILTRMEDTQFEDCHNDFSLDQLIDEVKDYGYGWDLDMIDVDKELEVNGERFVEGGQHSDLVWVPGWLDDLPRKVHLCGCFDGECIEDMEIALKAAGKEVIRVEHLII